MLRFGMHPHTATADGITVRNTEKISIVWILSQTGLFELLKLDTIHFAQCTEIKAHRKKSAQIKNS